MKQKLLTFLVILTVLAMFPGTALAASPSVASGVKTLPGSVPPWANSNNFVGAADPSATVGFRVYLGWNDSSGAATFAREVSDPNSSSYGKYLSASQFRQKYAPSASQVSSVQNWLKSQGFSLVATPANNHYVSAQGTVAQAEAAFGAQFGMYKVKGVTVRSPSTDISIPDSLGTIVTGVVGLDDSPVFIQPDLIRDAPPTAGFRNAPPLPTYWGGVVSQYAYPKGFTAVTSPANAPWAVKGYLPSQLRGAYGVPTSLNGSGQTVAIIDAYASPTISQDVNEWSSRHGVPTLKSGQLVQVVPPGIYRRPNNPRQDPSGWYGEETLDVEAVHGIAPAAKIVFVGAPNNYQDLDASMNYIVDRQLAQIVTNSYGFSSEYLPRGYIKPFNDTLIQAVAEGIGVYFSSGDNGDETQNTGVTSADWPASSPWVTAVGGTSIAVAQDNTRVFETGWGTSNYNCDPSTLACTRTAWLYGAGGGVSKLFNVPVYQSGLGLSGRGVPDVAAIADPQTGMLVGQTQTFPDGTYYDEYRIGGTSLASPIFAGLMALLDQQSAHPHGFANQLFYANPSAFYDVKSVKTAVARRNFVNGVDASNGTVDRLRTFDDYSGSPTQHTGAGWDDVTGLGAPQQQFFSLP